MSDVKLKKRKKACALMWRVISAAGTAKESSLQTAPVCVFTEGASESSARLLLVSGRSIT